MPIEVVCPCGKSYAVRDEFAGMSVQCPDCKALLTIPTPPKVTRPPGVQIEVIREEPRPVRIEVIREEPRPVRVAQPRIVEEPPRRRERDDRPRRPQRETVGVSAGMGMFPWLLLGGMVLGLLAVLVVMGVLLLPSGSSSDKSTAGADTTKPGEPDEPDPVEPEPQFTGQPWGGHSAPIVAVLFTADERAVLSASGGVRQERGKVRRFGDSTVRRWDARTGKGLRLLSDFPEGITAAAFTPDGRRAVLGAAGQVQNGKWIFGKEMAVQVWDLEEPRRIHSLSGHSGTIHGLAISRDGRRALSGSDDGTARLWDLEAGRELKVLQGHSQAVHGVALSPNGKWALTGGADHSVRLWDLGAGFDRKLGAHSDAVWAVAFSPDGRWAASAGGRHKGGTGEGDCEIRLWDVAAGTEVRRLSGHTGWVGSLAFSPDSQRLLSGGADAVRVWLVNSGEQATQYTGFLGGIRSLAISPDGRQGLSGGEDGALRVWKMPLGLSDLVHDVRSGDPQRQGEALRALSRMGPEARPAANALLQSLPGNNEFLRRQILSTLRQMGKASAAEVPQLVRLVEDNTDTDSRLYALEALEQVGAQAQAAAGPAIKALKDRDSQVRLQAVKVLGELGADARDTTWRPLVDALQDGDAEVSLAAEKALGKLGPPPAGELATLRKLLKDSQTPVRRFAVRALAGLGKDAADATGDLIALAESDAPVELRRLALQTLRQAQPAGKEVVAACTRLIKEGKESVSEEAALVLAAAGMGAGTLPGLLAALQSEDRTVSQIAEKAIHDGRLERSHLRLLQPLLSSRNATARKVGIESLGRLGPDAGPAAPALGRMLRDASAEERRAIILTLGEIGKAAQEAGPALAQLLEDTDAAISFEAALALVKIEAPEMDAAVVVLVRSLKTGEASRERAHKALVQVGKPAVAGLVHALTGTFATGRPNTEAGVANGEARLAVIKVLAEMGAKARTPEVMRTLASLERRDPFPLIRLTARQARVKIQSKDDDD
jgi:WD40 repeat protein